ncbi:hypothetical protein [Methylomonas methanica]|uniref:Uncharacterized protein n=1 Tax=Methylomonas methanica (strain DSM 25384 / MC09) TaxID=857087 RepID=G0A003_METMM|nr:hypothetical protein [Methylomonas methanica]AEF99971.1 hypothetical protein Metme_1552 [Methylomonas methanica MC09]
MNKARIIILLMGILSFSSAFGGPPEEQFWTWFEKNEKMLFDLEKDRERVFDKLSKQMEKVHPDLTFEFSPVKENGKREFIISAGGVKKAFPAVEALFSVAPNLARWQFIKYRPRRSPLNDLEYGGKSVKSKDVRYGMYKDGDKVGIVLFFDGYSEKEKNVFGNIGYLFLDEALGEYDIETKVGFIEFHGRDSKQYVNSKPLEELAENFDVYFRSKGK